MTEDFHLRFEWLDGSGVRDDALRATFARLEINVGDLRVTRAFDRRVQTVVEGIHVALLPLATWAVDAWWTAVAELPRSVRVRSVREVDTSEERRWHRRHGWLSSREGFAVPEVVFSRGEGDATRLSWFNEPETDDTMPLLFLAHGTELVPRDVVQAELARLIDGVLARCEGIGSPVVEALRERWAMIGSAAETERRVCERSARMGLDAYDDREVEDALAALLGRSDIAVGDPLVDDLLDLSKLQSNGFSLRMQRVDLGALVAATVDGFLIDASERDIQLTTNLRDVLPIDADRDRMAQVVANLVQNALKFAATTIVVGTTAEGTEAVLWVDDDGPGIAAQDLPHVFERLYVSAHRPARKEASSGLGLAITKELVEAMGGRVTAGAAPTGGARLVVRLPLR